MQSRQFCVGQRSGCEVAVHAVKQTYNEEVTEGVILLSMQGMPLTGENEENTSPEDNKASLCHERY